MLKKYLVMMFIVFTIALFHQSCDNDPISPHEDIATISYVQEVSPGNYSAPFATFTLNTSNVIYLQKALMKSPVFEASSVEFTIPGHINLKSSKIFVAFKSESEGWGEWEMSQGQFSLYCVGQGVNRNYIINVNPTPCKFQGKIYCFSLNDEADHQEGIDIPVIMTIDSVVKDTLKINSARNYLPTNNLLSISRSKLPEKLPDSGVGIKITGNTDTYRFGCLFINSNDEYMKVQQPTSALTIGISLDKIEPEYKSWFFAVSK